VNKPQPPSPSNFIRQIVEADLSSGKHRSIRTRFPPEPNGYLHFGHTKAICLNFGLAQSYGGTCNLRFDDTNPEKEEQEYVDAIKEMVRWLGFSWEDDGTLREFYASDYFEQLYGFAEELIRRGFAYVDSQSPDEIRESRGTLTSPGRSSPFRERGVEENLRLLKSMKEGAFPDGSHVLRAKIDMASPNMNLRDPVMYRIRHALHHRTGRKWCIYPTYDWAHGTSDAIEHVTHSLCTLEFEDHRPLYDWFNERLAELGLFEKDSLPRQIEFARLNLTYVVLSKRKLIELVEQKQVDGWDDPRMPTLAGARRRGYTPEGLRAFAEEIGVSKAHQLIDFGVLEECMRRHLNEIAPRRMAVLDPVKLVIENYPEGKEEPCEVPNHPQKPDWGKRSVPFSRELWIEREDFQETPAKGYFRLFPGNQVRLRYGFVVKCLGFDKATDSVRCEYLADSKSGTPGADKYKVKGNIHWVSVPHAVAAPVLLYDRLYKVAQPDETSELNPDSMRRITAQLEPSLRDVFQIEKSQDAVTGPPGEERFQFERHGYFIVDPKTGAFNRTVTLRDSWGAHGAK
jgi:glutaminyl-tRNA synthetase